MNRRRLLICGAWIFGLLVLVGLAAFAGSKTGGTAALTPSGGFAENGEYPTTTHAGVLTKRYASWNGSDSRTGTLTSDPFVMGFGLTLAVSGYPSHAGESVRIERIDGDGSFDLHLPDAGEAWRYVRITTPLNWAGHRVRLVAVDNARAVQGWFGISDVRRDSALAVINGDARFQLFLVTLPALLLFLPALSLARRLCEAAGLPDLFVFAAALVILGLAAEAVFFLTMADTALAMIVTIVAAIAGSILTLLDLRLPENGARLLRSDVWIPFALTTFAIVFYIATADVTVAANQPASFLPMFNLPSDNFLPKILADHISAHAPPKPFVGDWLSSDRPPLQAGFDLFGHALAPFYNDTYMRYQGLATLLQTTVFGCIFILCRACGYGKRRSIAIVSLTVVSGFFFINSLYVWPKLLSTSYLVIAIAVGCMRLAYTRVQSALIGICAALALLSHGGIVFTIPALIAAFAVRERAKSVRIFAVALAALVVLMVPWICYQHFYDPPADRLLKWHLAGHEEITPVPFSKLLIDGYIHVPVQQTVSYKTANFHTLWGDEVAPAYKEFYFAGRAIVWLLMPFLFAAAFVRRQRFRTAGIFAWISIASLIFWCLAMYGPATTILHQGSYLTMALMYVAGAIIATEWWPLFALIAALQLYDFIHVWMAPFSFQETFTAGGMVTLIGCVIVAALLLAVLRNAKPVEQAV